MVAYIAVRLKRYSPAAFKIALDIEPFLELTETATGSYER